MFMLMNTKYLKQLQDNQLEDLIENWNSKNGNYLSKTPCPRGQDQSNRDQEGLELINRSHNILKLEVVLFLPL